MPSSSKPTPFGDSAAEYIEKGWRPFPLPVEKKDPPPKGWTGEAGKRPTEGRVRRWAQEKPRNNVGLRLPRGVIGVDVDAYFPKHGAETLSKHEAIWGPLPATFVSTSRDDGSGIRLFRVPKIDGKHLRTAGVLDGGDVELIQRHHRYVVAPPSIHPTTGEPYRWIGPDGEESDVPAVRDLPALPPRWREGLAGMGTLPTDKAAPSKGRELQASLPTGPMDPKVRDTLMEALDALRSGTGSRHDTVRGKVLRLVRFGDRGCAGVPEALDSLRPVFLDATQRPGSEGEREFERMVEGATCVVAMSRNESRKRSDVARFKVVSPSDLAAPVPAMRWMIEDVWPENSYGVMAGEKKSFKSWHASALGLAVASGEPLFGHFPVEKSGPVLYFVGEGGEIPYRRRIQRLADAYKVELGDVPFHAVFGSDSLAGAEFADVLARRLDELQPVLVVLDPLYAYHPPGIEAQNLYERGQMLNGLTQSIDGEAALIIVDHFKKTTERVHLDLDLIAQSGMGAWADSWALQAHAEPPNLIDGKFRLWVDYGTRQESGSSWNLDLSIPNPDRSGVEEKYDRITWSIASGDGRKSGQPDAGNKERRSAAIQIVRDNPFELTPTALVGKIGSNKPNTRRMVKELTDEGYFLLKKAPGKEGARTVGRERVGPGPLMTGSTPPGLPGVVGV